MRTATAPPPCGDTARDTAAALLHRHRGIREATTFRLLGEEWDLLPGVYGPHLTRSAALYAEWLPVPAGGSFCELGTGCGYLAVTAARRGAARVTASDLTGAAVANTRLNAARHGVADRVTVRQGDLFEALDPGERHDVVFWNSNFVPAGEDEEAGDLEAAFLDPGYRTHERFLADVADHLTDTGRVFLGFTDLGDRNRLAAIARRRGWAGRVVRAARIREPGAELGVQLIEFRHRARSGGHR